MAAPATQLPDSRLERLQQPDQKLLTGIDFVFVHDDQRTLDVYFVRRPSTMEPPFEPFAEDVEIRSQDAEPRLREIEVEDLEWTTREGREVLRLHVAEPGDFSIYTLTITTTVDDDSVPVADRDTRPRIDPFFNGVSFRFQAGCPTDLDCADDRAICPEDEAVDVGIDYRARDFWGIRRALMEFARVRYPRWNAGLIRADGTGMDRAADIGVMLAETFSALGDESSYYQDRIARELHFDRATQRRSLRRHARLIDYAIHDGMGASTWIDVEVDPAVHPGTLKLDAGLGLVAEDDRIGIEHANPDEQRARQVHFELGLGLSDVVDLPKEKEYAVNARWNEWSAHLWDPERPCLPAGTTELAVEGHLAGSLVLDDDPMPAVRPAGRWVLLELRPADPAQPVRTWPVRVIDVAPGQDPLDGSPVTRLRWEAAQATPWELDVRVLRVRGNLVPATVGKTHSERFFIANAGAVPAQPVTVERLGPNGSVTHLFSLPGSDRSRLVWRPPTGLDAIGRGGEVRATRPEVRLSALTPSSVSWRWRRSFVGTNASHPEDRDYSLDDAHYAPVIHFQKDGERVEHIDYHDGDGVSLRFGDGAFGQVPGPGVEFEAHYRLGLSENANVARGAIKRLEGAWPAGLSVRNPMAVTDGMRAESAAEIRLLAPDAYKAETHRAVRPDDYAMEAEKLAWVQRAGAQLRWTGSWPSLFVTPDPRNSQELTPSESGDLGQHLDRVRQAGREVHISAPRYADFDLRIRICADPSSYPGQVKEDVLTALVGTSAWAMDGTFFDPDRFTFAQALSRSALEAAVQRVAGVRAVEAIDVRRRRYFDWRPFSELVLTVAADEVVRVTNDPLHPERGSVYIETEGGA